MTDSAQQAPAPDLRQLFFGMLQVALSAFGGGLSAWSQRIVVEQKRWMTDEEFLTAGIVKLDACDPGIFGVGEWLSMSRYIYRFDPWNVTPADFRCKASGMLFVFGFFGQHGPATAGLHG